jgi:hypothetical protein
VEVTVVLVPALMRSLCHQLVMLLLRLLLSTFYFEVALLLLV